MRNGNKKAHMKMIFTTTKPDAEMPRVKASFLSGAKNTNKNKMNSLLHQFVHKSLFIAFILLLRK